MTPIHPARNSQAKFLLLLATGLLLTVSAGYTYGLYSQRWGATVDLQAAGEHLQTLPQQLGDWQMLDKLVLAESTVEMLQCAGYTNRRYINQKTGDVIHLAIIVGPPGPIAVHTPEICYSSRAYTLLDSKSMVTLKGTQEDSHTFWKTTFQPNDVNADQLRVYYAWTPQPTQDASATWTAATNGRYQYGQEPMLYKIQIAGPLTPDGSTEDRDGSRQFLAALCQSGWELSNSHD